MNFFLVFVLFGCILFECQGMLYRKDNNVLKPDLIPISSTVLPLPYHSVYGYEKKQIQNRHKKRPPGKISLVVHPTDE